MSRSPLFDKLTDAAHSKALLEETHKKFGLRFCITFTVCNVDPVFVTEGRMGGFVCSRMVMLNECEQSHEALNPLTETLKILQGKLFKAWEQKLLSKKDPPTAIV